MSETSNVFNLNNDVNPKQRAFYKALCKIAEEHVYELTCIDMVGALECMKEEVIHFHRGLNEE